MGTPHICINVSLSKPLKKEKSYLEKELFLEKGLHFWREGNILGGLISGGGTFLQRERGPKYRPRQTCHL
jgi:hypothetical protein